MPYKIYFVINFGGIIIGNIIFTEAVPKKILEQMNVPGLRRENVASHLQVILIYEFI